MAAPIKVGLDYFPVYMTLLRDRKLRPVKMKYGYLGTMVYILLLGLIYEDKGYYAEYSDNLIWDILELLQGKYQPDAETVKDVIEMLVACELFSGDLYKSKILTSKRIQKTFYSSTVKRTNLTVDRKIWLLSLDEMKAISVRSSILSFCINDGNNEVNDGNNDNKAVNNPQSKVKKSKVKNIYSSDSFPMKAAGILRDGTLALFPKQKVPKTDEELSKWAEHIDKMIRIDKRSERDILDVIDFALNDDFWKLNIRSADKLRKQFDNLYVKMTAQKGRAIPKTDAKKSLTDEYFRQMEEM